MSLSKTKENKPIITQIRNDNEFLENVDFILGKSTHTDKTEIIKSAVRYYKRLFENNSPLIKIMLSK